jgi:hypothetical protein
MSTDPRDDAATEAGAHIADEMRKNVLLASAGAKPKRNNSEPFRRIKEYMEDVDLIHAEHGTAGALAWMREHPYISRGKGRAKPFQRTILARYPAGKKYPHHSARECERRRIGGFYNVKTA